MPSVGLVTLELVCLDGWKFEVQGGDLRQHSSSAMENESLFVGTVPLRDFDTFLASVAELLIDAEKHTGVNRSAAKNQQGNQKTPAMIQAVMIDALAGRTSGETLPRGGLTDVGLHTGGHSRNTAWPLVSAVLQILLESQGRHNLCRVLMAEFKLSCVELMLSEDTINIDLDTVMQMLKAAAIEGSTLIDHILDYDTKDFEDRCILIRSEVDRITQERMQLAAQAFSLPKLNEWEISRRNIILELSGETTPAHSASDPNSIRKLVDANIGWLPLPIYFNSWESLSSWLDQPKMNENQDISSVLLVTNTVERVSFKLVSELFGDSSVMFSISTLEKIIERYRSAIAVLLTLNPPTALRKTEIRSREVLVVWIAACFAHSATLYDPISILKEYSFALNYKDLCFLSFAEKDAFDAVSTVATYIRSFNNAASKKCVFSTRQSDATMEFAMHYSELFSTTKSIWEVEHTAATVAKQTHWQEVLNKKQKLQQLDAQLRDLENSLTVCRTKLKMYEQPAWNGSRETAVENYEEHNKTNSEIGSLESEIVSKKKTMVNTEIAPHPVFQSLPADKQKAMSVLFFLYMPEMYRTLSRLIFMAQQMLLPTADNICIAGLRSCDNVDVAALIAVESPKTLWRSHFMYRKAASTLTPVEPALVLGSSNATVSGSNWYPKNVRQFTSADQGVWYPDTLEPALFWSGANSLDHRGYYFNPFASISKDVIVHTFTEKLPEHYQSMQWAMVQSGYDTCPSRSNWPEAVQDEMVGGKIEHMSFGGIRAFPNQQLRKLCVVLRERSLPLDKPAVHSLLRQTLFHLGELSDDNIPDVLWWRDRKGYLDGLSTLCMELEALREEVQSMSRYHGAILILGEMAAFVSQWRASSREVARGFASIAKSWAAQAAEDIVTADMTKVAEFRARQCVLTMYSIVCHSFGELTSDDVQELLNLTVLSENSRLFEEATSYDTQIRALTVITRNVISHRLPTILLILDTHPHFLTASCKLIMEQTQHDLEWFPYKCDSQSFEAVASSGDDFGINVQTGVVLFNGLPPRRLPSTIVNSRKYKRTFGNSNFDVVLTKDNVLKTTRSIKGCFYEFFEAIDGSLIIREFGSRRRDILELLDGNEEELQIWGKDLPVRLQKMYSHWHCRERAVVVLRSKHFDERSVCFLCKQESEHFICYRVPENLRQTAWFDLCDNSMLYSFDRLVQERLPNMCPIVNILKKFERSSSFIHVFSAGQSTATIFELPRYGLSFSLSADMHGKAIESNDYRGFRLRNSQLFEDDLQGFEQYLVLESTRSGEVLVLISSGTIVKSQAYVNGSISFDAERKYHCYRRHRRFGNLEVGAGPLAIESRLQLAAIYAATDSEVPRIKAFASTGAEVAIELLRQSWVNRPLRETEYRHLRSITECSRFSSSLALLCYEIDHSSREFVFLFKEKECCLPLTVNVDMASQYVQRKRVRQLNSRLLLSADEETIVLGRPILTRLQLTNRGPIPATVCPLQDTKPYQYLLESFERELQNLFRRRVPKRADPFPLPSLDFQESKIGVSMLSELENSWCEYQALEISADEVISNDLSTMNDMWYHVKKTRKKLEHDLLWTIKALPDGVSCPFKMRRAANLEPFATIRDLVKCLLLPDSIKLFNPFLSNEVQETFLAHILVWLQFCVLEDKMERMYYLVSDNNTQEFLRELKEVGRTWDIRDYPEWLVFEVEQGLQIRRIQYTVARQLMKNPGAIAQLNMGEGKTRVILPMLVLAMANQDSLIRLHFLSALLGEVYDYLHRNLTASFSLRRLYLLPFQRDVVLSEDDALKMYDNLSRCRESRGAICIAPEHRLSLELKWFELRSSINGADNVNVCSLLQKIKSLPYLDIIDESDEVLRHKYQLIYSVGSCFSLPDGVDRCVACQAVLYQLQVNEEVAKILSIPEVSRRVSVLTAHGAGAFDDIRLLPGPEFLQIRHTLMKQLVSGIIDNPPHHMRWLKKSPTLRNKIITFATDPKDCWPPSIEQIQLRQLLAMRGLLAYGIFENCLVARHRKDYGVDQRRGFKCRGAVPYRASDTPSDSSEYKQVEMFLLRTILAYYHSSISRTEVKEAVSLLLILGPIAQCAEYALWLESARPTMTHEQLNSLDSVAKLDLTNEVQLDLLHDVFRYNMATINFWLNTCVFPTETLQFPHSLIANAFHLADNNQGKVIGFSGTKDTHLLLPHQVEQSMHVHPELTATDGKMLDLIGPKNNQTVEVIDESINVSSGVLQLAAGRGYNSLIDAGGTMAGLSNGVVAMRILELLSRCGSALKGVVYFDVSDNTWYIIDLREKCLPKGSSPIHESEAFVYFDESRCRGADMKLSSDARALLTIGPGMCKDKLIQAAGRMRKLQFGQKITMAVPPELLHKIVPSNGRITVTPMQILTWVLKNTIEAVKEGLSEWGAQGIYFASSYNNSDARLVDETLDLENMYGAAIKESSVFNAVRSCKDVELFRIKQLNIDLKDEGRLALQTVLNRVEQFGSDVCIKSTGREDECERELENEKEIEQEIQRQIPRQNPAVPKAWPFNTVLSVDSPEQLNPAIGVLSLRNAVHLRLNPDLSSIDWDLCRIFVTQNFIETVTSQDDTRLKDLSDYMKTVDAVLVFRSGDCLLVSEWEADKILEILWKVDRSSEGSSCSVSMCSVSYLLKAADSNWASPPELLVPRRSQLDLKMGFCPLPHTLAALSLFSGGTMFAKRSCKRALMEMLHHLPGGKRVALLLPMFRGRPHMIARSDLDEICSDLSV